MSDLSIDAIKRCVKFKAVTGTFISLPLQRRAPSADLRQPKPLMTSRRDIDMDHGTPVDRWQSF
ncbi:MAG: hypothetical protein M9932_13785 [Xanthobacteraceae bacterium]|nr:hypothetical protein [Xanthobacteraceae bacterium]